MADALIGYTGYVGSTLLRQKSFKWLYNSTNIHEIEGKSFDTVICAGVSAKKWLANKEPHKDLWSINNLISCLKRIHCKTFILISTVDVFNYPVMVDEKTLVSEAGLSSYGLNRRVLEQFTENYFSNNLIVRLPGLVGPGLRKNIVFDLLHSNNLKEIESRSIYQFYPMVNLWYDIEIALNHGLHLVHLTAEPISIAEVSVKGFNRRLQQFQQSTPVKYDMRTCHARLFGSLSHYQYSVRDTIQAIRSYSQSEFLAAPRI